MFNSNTLLVLELIAAAIILIVLIFASQDARWLFRNGMRFEVHGEPDEAYPRSRFRAWIALPLRHHNHVVWALLRYSIGVVAVVTLVGLHHVTWTPDNPPPKSHRPATLSICSFNIKFLGHYKDKRAAELANLVSDYDIVAIQEMVAPPVGGTFPDGTPYAADDESRAFFESMQSLGFTLSLSPEDTGKDTIHRGGTSSEWFAAFYKDTVQPAEDLPHGFLSDVRAGNKIYDRVPFAHSFRTHDGKFDFVLINVHLKANPSASDGRRMELQGISDWIASHDTNEKDFIILGDMNIQSKQELESVIPAGFVSLNASCCRTNLSSLPKPFDHVMIRSQFTTEVAMSSFEVLDLISEMQPFWTGPDAYPGIPYNGPRFSQLFSDHEPIEFLAILPNVDDDH